MPTLADSYSKWNTLSDEDCTAGMDLDALTGDPSEVAAIRKAWGREDGATNSNGGAAAPAQPQAAAYGSAAQQAPVHAREEQAAVAVGGAPGTAGASKVAEHEDEPTDQLAAHYKRWGTFDAEEAIRELENKERKDPEEADTMCRGGAGSVMVESVGYKKDAEEHRVDNEFDETSAALKQRVAARFRTAHCCKEEGNTALKKSPAAAERLYADGAAAVQYCLEVLVLVTPSMQEKITTLATALHSNRAHALLQVGGQESAAAAACTEGLKLTPGHEKCLYRRAAAYAALGDVKQALLDLSALPATNTAAAKLRASLTTQCEA